jgi:hypothetical protein
LIDQIQGEPLQSESKERSPRSCCS